MPILKCFHSLSCCLLLGTLTVHATADELRFVRYTNLWTDSEAACSDAAGITYLHASGRLLISDSEISEYGSLDDPLTFEPVFRGSNVFEVSLDGKLVFNKWLALPADGTATEPVGIAAGLKADEVFITNDDTNTLALYSLSSQQHVRRPLKSILTDAQVQYSDPEGVCVDPVSLDLLVVSGTKDECVLRFRYDREVSEFTYVAKFAVGDHISDPEGIAIHPVDQHVFLIAKSGIAEFSDTGDFVHFFPYDFEMPKFWQGSDMGSALPGGGTFAPSSDPNDLRSKLSLYVTCRGIDNGRFPESNSLDGGLLELELLRDPEHMPTIRVPQDFETIQLAIDSATDGDTIVVAPGTYAGSVDLGSKVVNLVSEHYISRDPQTIAATVIDGQAGDFVIRVGKRQVDSVPLIRGFTIQNADDGITSTGTFNLEHCRVTKASDGIDYEAGGGYVRFCRFDSNRDDAIDLDGATAATIEHCELVNNGDDGIEIRLQPYTADKPLKIVVRDNLISGNNEDGIQLIGYDVETAREFTFEGNRIVANAMAGIGLMSGANTREDYEAAPLPEQIIVNNCTFSANRIHISGGARMLVANNILHNAVETSLKQQIGQSLIHRNLVWDGERRTSANSLGNEPRFSIYADPNFVDSSYSPSPRSPAIGAAVRRVIWNGKHYTLVPNAEYRGKRPDLGAIEY